MHGDALYTFEPGVADAKVVTSDPKAIMHDIPRPVRGYSTPRTLTYGLYGIGDWQQSALTGAHVSPPYIPPGGAIPAAYLGAGSPTMTIARNLPADANGWANDPSFGAELMVLR